MTLSYLVFKNFHNMKHFKIIAMFKIGEVLFKTSQKKLMIPMNYVRFAVIMYPDFTMDFSLANPVKGSLNVLFIIINNMNVYPKKLKILG